MQEEELLLMLRLAWGAYDNTVGAHFPGAVGEAAGLYCVDNVKTDIQYHVFVEAERITVAFRGSDSMQDAIADADFLYCAIGGMRVHCGFWNAYKKARVLERLFGLITKSTKALRITGHSYGGALAALCGWELAARYTDIPCEVVMFGSPRVGNCAFRKSFNSLVPNAIRVENGNDLVTRVPFAVLGYRHVGKLFHIGVPRKLFEASFFDHHASEYEKSLIHAKNGDKISKVCNAK